MEGDVEGMLLDMPTIVLMSCWHFFVIAQVGFFAVAMVIFLLWPRHPKWMTSPYAILAPTEALGLLLTVAIIGLAAGG